MITLEDVIRAIEKGHVPLAMAVDLSSNFSSIWNSRQNVAGQMCEILQLIGAGVSPKLAIEATEMAVKYFNLKNPPYRWKKDALKALRTKELSEQFLKNRHLANQRANPPRFDPPMKTSIAHAWMAIDHTLAAVSYAVRDIQATSIRICYAVSNADMAFAEANSREDADKIIDLIKRRFEQPTVHQIVAAAARAGR